VSTSLSLTDRPGVRLVASTPADDEARLALMRLSEIGPLRIDWVIPESFEEPDTVPALQTR